MKCNLSINKAKICLPRLRFRRIAGGLSAICALSLIACASTTKPSADTDSAASANDDQPELLFSGDSAYAYVDRQVDFGPRVPNTEAHRLAGEWLASELKRHGAEVVTQPLKLKAFDGTILQSVNILGRYNPDAKDRLLLLAHWDCRPWADEDDEPANRKTPVDGANDGASGVGVLLEIARQLHLTAPTKGVDILFVDAEDWGCEGDDYSWALGAQAFVDNPPVASYSPSEAILLDMVGGENARFHREYFSQKAAPQLNNALWNIASSIGVGEQFVNRLGGAITDDHIRFIDAGIPTVDIIEYNEEGFNPRWHTTHDTMDGISKETLSAVGNVVLTYIRNNY